jgi:N-acetyllactosaminide beta-1,3-N-acetylglucosaminyltransferase
MFQLFTIARREGIFQRWEPIYVGTKKEPFFDERLTWDGLQDKMSQALEMCLIGYRFVVLDSAFLVHRPGVRAVMHTSNQPSEKRRQPFIKHNNNVTKIIHEEFKIKYPGAFKRGKCIQDT